MEATLEGLQKQTVYVLRMLGYSEGGDGKLSESVYFTVLGKKDTLSFSINKYLLRMK